MGGTFDPIHLGHLALARQAMRAAGLDRILFLPSGRPPHKEASITDPEHRLSMTRLAVQSEAGMSVSDMESRRPGATYTVDTLRALHAEREGTYAFLVGSDTLLDVPNWRAPEQVAAMCAFVVLPRQGVDERRVRETIRLLEDRYGARITAVPIPIPDISSTQIRERVRLGLALDGLVPEAVAEYIGRHRLYNPPRTLSPDEMVRQLTRMVPEERLAHSIGTMEEAVRLAERFDGPVEQARVAGLLHDCAKGLSLAAMREQAREIGVAVDPERWQYEELLHAPLGAALLRKVFGVTDPDIVRAVKWHNTGTSPMEKLDLILYLADKIEPTRRRRYGLDVVRRLALTSLEKATAESMRQSLEYLKRSGRWAHPDTLAAYEALIQKS